ncbi:DUF5085 family protein [Cohnella fermenti]|uniref:DUF5085 family protein n=1 Tax=Cohnella fermenti TaxID=2565925 RepID=A0A4V3WDW6_9BACL|nr:DUF5085 family protein [Cohnella fermenti]THF73930.1 DUF5085 family protein [Cohnella fermenti]
MVNPSDSIRHTNVLSKRYRFHYTEMERALEQFTSEVDRLQASPKAPLFYSLNNVPMDEFMNVEFFLPVQEDRVDVRDDMIFHSYFSVEDMISCSIHTHIEAYTEVAYRILLEYIKQKELLQATPVFHVLSGDRTLPYLSLKIGVQPKSE